MWRLIYPGGKEFNSSKSNLVIVIFFPLAPPLSPVPSSNLYAQLNGLQLCLDAPSVLWMTLFSRGLHRTLDQVKAFYHLQDSSKTDEHIDIRLDATQLKVNQLCALKEMFRKRKIQMLLGSFWCYFFKLIFLFFMVSRVSIQSCEFVSRNGI